MHTVEGSRRAAQHRAAWRDPHTPPSRFDTGRPCAGGAESRGSGADRVATPSGALDAVPDALDPEPGAEGDGPQPRSRLDLDDTRGCPLAAGCETCGAVDDLALGTAETAVGVFCLTLCGSCAEAGDLPSSPSWTAVVARVIEHCEHLGVTVDEAAAARRAECSGCGSSNTLDLGRGDHECRECRQTFRRPR